MILYQSSLLCIYAAINVIAGSNVSFIISEIDAWTINNSLNGLTNFECDVAYEKKGIVPSILFTVLWCFVY